MASGGSVTGRAGFAAIDPPRASPRRSSHNEIAWWLLVLSLAAAHLGVWVGNAGAVGLLGAWVLYTVLWPMRAARALMTSAWPWLFPAFAVASTLWSVQPGLSFRQGLELVAFTGVGTLIGGALSPRRIASGFLVAMLIVAVGGLADGGQTAVQHAGSMAATGGLGSKNTFAAVGGMLLLAAACCAADAGQDRAARWLGAACVPFGMAILIVARSTGATGATAGALVLAVGLAAAARVRPPWRGAVLALAALLAVAALGWALGAGASIGWDRLLADIGKDSGLSGRAFLWQRAAELIGERPLLGIGYQAFWVQDTPDAEGLWRAAGIASRYGFHFHNLYYEAAVELGLLGVTLLAATMIATAIRVLYWGFTVDLMPACFFIALLAVFVLRSYSELDFVFPIADGTVALPMIFIVAARGVMRRSSSSSSSSPSR